MASGSPVGESDRVRRSLVIALGANLPGAAGSVQEGLEAALDRLASYGFEVWARSAWWRSAAWPDPADPPFLNGVALAETALDPDAALARLHAIEEEFGRMRGAANAPRPLDLDLIAYGRVVREGRLRLPHPQAYRRRFVMGPLAEIAPDWVHPVLGQTAIALAAAADVGIDAAPA